MKRLLTVILAVIMLMVPCTAFGASNSPVLLDKMNVTAKNIVYNGKFQTVPLTVTVNGKTLVDGKDFQLVSGYSHKNVGTYTVTLKGIGKFKGTIKLDYQIKKAKNIVALTQEKSVTRPTTANKVIATQAGSGKITKWSLAPLKNPKNAKYISVDTKTGKVTVKKGAPKGTFKVKITFAGDANHVGRITTVTIRVK